MSIDFREKIKDNTYLFNDDHDKLVNINDDLYLGVFADSQILLAIPLKIEEEKLFKTSTEINKLLESLNNLENTENESKTQ